MNTIHHMHWSMNLQDETESRVLLPIRRELEIALSVAEQIAANIPTVERLARVIEYEEQLTLLDAVEFGFIEPV